MSEARTHRLAGGSGGRLLKVLGIAMLFTCIIVPLALMALPLAILSFSMRKRAYVTTDAEGLTLHWWKSTRTFRWDDVERIERGRLHRGAPRMGAGTARWFMARKLGKPVIFHLRGDEEPQQIPLTWFEAPDELLDTVRERTGLPLPGDPTEEEADEEETGGQAA
ncbi:MAG: hypothetical protein ACQEXJ_12610 [Myxococcota bacterium]